MGIRVPEGMAKRVIQKMLEAKKGPWIPDESSMEYYLSAFAENLASHPIVPTDEQCAELEKVSPAENYERGIAVEWQRIMFAAPDNRKIAGEYAHHPDGPWYPLYVGDNDMSGKITYFKMFGKEDSNG